MKVQITDEIKIYNDNKAKAEQAGMSPSQAARTAKIAKTMRNGVVTDSGEVLSEANAIARGLM